MTSLTYYRPKSHADKFYTNYGGKRNNNYNPRQFSNGPALPYAKNSINFYDNKQKNYYEAQFDYLPPKKVFQFDSDENSKFRPNKASNSGYSTMASEGDLEPELAGIKIAHSGKILLDAQTSDSDSSFTPVGRNDDKKVSCFASAVNYLGPSPREISVPSFL